MQQKLTLDDNLPLSVEKTPASVFPVPKCEFRESEKTPVNSVTASRSLEQITCAQKLSSKTNRLNLQEKTVFTRYTVYSSRQITPNRRFRLKKL